MRSATFNPGLNWQFYGFWYSLQPPHVSITVEKHELSTRIRIRYPNDVKSPDVEWPILVDAVLDFWFDINRLNEFPGYCGWFSARQSLKVPKTFIGSSRSRNFQAVCKSKFG